MKQRERPLVQPTREAVGTPQRRTSSSEEPWRVHGGNAASRSAGRASCALPDAQQSTELYSRDFRAEAARSFQQLRLAPSSRLKRR